MIDLVIPTLNEATAIASLLPAVRAQQNIECRLLVADGGSTDGTGTVVRELGAELIHSEAGRGRQMNAGAAAGSADWLLFLHADSGLTHAQQLADALAALRQEISAQNDRVAGHFALSFTDTGDRAPLFYRQLEAKTTQNRRETFNGDQGLMLSRRWFRELGGFDASLPFLEDQLIADDIRTQGRFITLPHRLQTSARRFRAEGEAQRYFLMTVIMSARRAGMDEFFARAPGVYADQADARRLDLLPFMELFAELAGSDHQTWDALGDYGLENLWQLVQLAEVASGQQLLPHFDRWIAPRVRGTWSRRVTGAVFRHALLKPLLWRLRHRDQTA